MKTSKNSFFFSVGKHTETNYAVFKWSPRTNLVTWKVNGKIKDCKYIRSEVDYYVSNNYWHILEGVKCL